MWAATTTVRAGDEVAAVRSCSAALDAVVRRVLAEHLAAGGAPTREYGLHLSAPAGTRGLQLSAGAPRGARGVHHLIAGSRVAVRARSASRLLDALLVHLAVDAGGCGELLRLRAVPVVGGSRALLLPAGIPGAVARVERRLWPRGACVADTPGAFLDPRSGEVVVPAPWVAADTDARARLAVLDGGGRDEPRPRPGRYRLAGWIVSAQAPATTRLRGAQALSAALAHVGDAAGLPDALRALALALADAPVLVAGAAENLASLAGQVWGT